MVDELSSRTFRYDALDRLVSGGSMSYAYDGSGNVLRRTYPDGTQASFSYDDDGRLGSVTKGSSTTGYGYDAAGNLTTTTLPSTNGYVQTQSYDRAGRLSGVRHANGTTVLADTTIIRDAVANPLTVAQTGASASTARYSYDVRDRLTEVCYQSSTCTSSSSPFIRWTYDAVGNRLTQARPSATTTYSYDVDDRLLSAGATTYGYDANGNETTAGSTTRIYNRSNRLSSTTTGRTTTTYKYDGDGRRRSASTGTQTANTTNYSWDTSTDLPEIVLETDAAGSALRSYLYGQQRIAMTTHGTGAGTFYYQHDHLGSATNLTSETGATQWMYSYEPFGAIKTETKSSNKAPANPMKFTGQHLDPTGLYHLRARQYDPGTGRFLTPDPLEAPTGSPHGSAYSYVDGRPTVYTDPSGLCFAICAAVGAVANTAVYAGSTLASGKKITLGGAAQAAGEGAAAGATGGVGGKVLARFARKLLKPAASKVTGAAGGGAAGGAVVTHARSLAQGCGPASVGASVRGAIAGAAGAGAGQHLYPQRGFEVRTLRGLLRDQPNTERVWQAAVLASLVEQAAEGGDSCGTGRNGK